MRERDQDFDRIQELEDALDTRQSELEALQAEVDDYSAEKNRRIAELEWQVNDKTGEVERLRSRMRMVENQNAGQDLQLVSLKKELKAKTEDFFQRNVGRDAKQLKRCVLSLPLRCMIDLYE
jgi:predicted nuclease with TOPRIM domain